MTSTKAIQDRNDHSTNFCWIDLLFQSVNLRIIALCRTVGSTSKGALMYSVTCPCGTTIEVNIWQSGTSVPCPRCAVDVRVPDSITLKRQSGDLYPHLGALEKIERTRDEREPPFHGVCHNCNKSRAQWVVPIRLDILTERHLRNDGGVSLGVTGLVLTAAGGEEYWKSVPIPLLLCTECYGRFQHSRKYGTAEEVLMGIGCLFLLAILVVIVWMFAEVFAAFSGLVWIVGAIAWALSKRGGVKMPNFIRPWLRKIRWLPEVLSKEDEYRVTVGEPQEIQHMP